MHTKILIIEDDERLAAAFQRILRRAGYGADVAVDYAGGKDLLTKSAYSAVFLDINLQGKQTGIDLLKTIRENAIETPVVIITGFPEVATAAAAVRNGAFDYLCKPIEKDQLLRIAGAAVTHKTLNDEKEGHRKNLEAALRSVRDTIVTADLGKTMAGLNKAENGLSVGKNRIGPEAAQNPVNSALSSQGMNQQILLSKREQQILAMLGQGESPADIAAALTISVRTVETYFSRVIDKLNLGGMKELRRYAIRNKPQ
jgi:FixJ family two-component response regulator